MARIIVDANAKKSKESLDALFWIKETVAFVAEDIVTSECQNVFCDSLAINSRRLLAKDAGKMTDNKKRILVLGLGNNLLSDDGVGPLVIDQLHHSPVCAAPDVWLRDGGTMGLSLLPDIEDCAGFIAIDAASFGAAPGTVRVFEGADMDALLTGNKKTAHEVALADLMGAAALAGSRPELRALVAVQPASTALGIAPTADVAAALPRVVQDTETLVVRWREAFIAGDALAAEETGAC